MDTAVTKEMALWTGQEKALGAHHKWFPKWNYRPNQQNPTKWASLVAQWLRICLPMQGTQVRALVWEDPTRRGATKPMRHNY